MVKPKISSLSPFGHTRLLLVSILPLRNESTAVNFMVVCSFFGGPSLFQEIVFRNSLRVAVEVLSIASA